MLAQIIARIKELEVQLEQSLVNHNFLAGALNEIKAVKNVYEKIHGSLPIIEEAIPVIEDVVKAVEEAVPAVEAAVQVL